MIGGKLKLKTSSKLQHALKLKRKAEMTNEELKDEVDRIQRHKEVKLQRMLEVQNQEDEYVVQPIQKGQGKLISSGKAIHGFETAFNQQLEIGDYIIIIDEQTQQQESRKVNMVLSARSCGVEEAFSNDIISKQEFTFQKKPQLKEKVKPMEELVAERLAKDKPLKRHKGDDDQEDRKKEHVIEMRVKTGEWSYKTVQEKVKNKPTREEELDMRVKKKTDKFCWF